MLDILTAFLAPSVRALTDAEVGSVIDKFGPSDIADIVDTYTAQARATGLEPVADDITVRVFERLSPIIDEIAINGTGLSPEQIKGASSLFRMACAHQVLLATFPGRAFEEIAEHIINLAMARARKTSVFSTGNVGRH